MSTSLRGHDQPSRIQTLTTSTFPAGVQRQLATQFGPTLDRLDVRQQILNGLQEGLIAARRNIDFLHGTLALAESAVPLGALGGLQAVLVAHLHEHAVVCQQLKDAGDSMTHGARVGGDVVNEKIGKRGRVGAHPEVDTLLPR